MRRRKRRFRAFAAADMIQWPQSGRFAADHRQLPDALVGLNHARQAPKRICPYRGGARPDPTSARASGQTARGIQQ
jgi:hypothetical protein